MEPLQDLDDSIQVKNHTIQFSIKKNCERLKCMKHFLVKTIKRQLKLFTKTPFVGGRFWEYVQGLFCFQKGFTHSLAEHMTRMRSE